MRHLAVNGVSNRESNTALELGKQNCEFYCLNSDLLIIVIKNLNYEKLVMCEYGEVSKSNMNNPNRYTHTGR